MKKFISTIIIAAMTVSLCGCAPKEPAPAETHTPAVYETVEWTVVSIEPEDYGITKDMLSCVDMPDFSQLTLAALCAFHLHTDGAGSEGSGDTLYARFMEAPNLVLNYLALIGDQFARGGATGNESAVTELCHTIASADVFWHDTTEAFSAIIKQYLEIYPDGRIAEILSTLQEEHDAAIKQNS